MSQYIIGIDPGGNGACVVLDMETGEIINCFEFAKLTLHEFCDGLREINNSETSHIKQAVIESCHSMPKQGVSSSFKFGRRCGEVEGILAALKIPYEFVTPQTWQRDMKCLSHGDKRLTRARAQQIYPLQRITNSNADAILITRWLWNKTNIIKENQDGKKET